MNINKENNSIEFNVVEDVSKITTIAPGALNKLVHIAMCCMCDYAEQLKIQHDEDYTDAMNVDIGIGNLIFSIEDGRLHYTFKPCAKFEKALIGAIVNGKNPLVKTIEKSIASRITNTYKDMF